MDEYEGLSLKLHRETHYHYFGQKINTRFETNLDLGLVPNIAMSK